MNRKWIILCSLAAASLFGVEAQKVTYFYEEVFGDQAWMGRYEVSSSASGTMLSYENPQENHRVSLDASLNGLDWSWKSDDGSARAERRGDAIILEGHLNGKTKRVEKAIGGFPWYQAPDYSFALLVDRPEGTRQTFWMILPDNLSFHRMTVRNAGPDEFKLGDFSASAVKMILSVSGVPELVWKNEYWYSSEGEYLGFKGRRGGPLSPVGTLRLLKKE